MSLKNTKHTGSWKHIPKKCKNCKKAIYTVEEGEVLYQCSLYGSFNKDCEHKIEIRKLPKPSEVLKKHKED